MAAIDYPCGLPGIILANFGMTENAHFRSNSVQSGPPINELMSDSTAAPVSVMWSFSQVEYQTFDAWWKYQINFGTTPFNIDIPVGAGLIEHECQFTEGGKPSFTRNGKRTHVTATIIATEKQFNNECDALNLLSLMTMTSEKDQCAFFDQFTAFANVDLPDAWENMLDNLGTDYS